MGENLPMAQPGHQMNPNRVDSNWHKINPQEVKTDHNLTVEHISELRRTHLFVQDHLCNICVKQYIK